MGTYIVRIYRRGLRESETVTGVVEEVGKPGKQGFDGPESLWKILTAPREGSDAGGRVPGKEGRKKGSMSLSEIMRRYAK